MTRSQCLRLEQKLVALLHANEPTADAPASITIAHAHIDQVIISTHTHITTIEAPSEEKTIADSDMTPGLHL